MPHIIPYAGRHHSGPVNQNLLWQDGNIYLMDNRERDEQATFFGFDFQEAARAVLVIA